MVSIQSVETKKDLKKFIRFPWFIYKSHSAWVPPMIKEQLRELNPQKGSFFEHSEAQLFLAYRDNELVGRIAAIRNNRHLEQHDDATGFFGFFECVDSVEVAAALVDKAAQWLRDRGMQRMRGPASFTVYDTCGVLLSGFDIRPSAGMAYTPKYYASLLESLGFEKSHDLYAMRLEFEKRDNAKLDNYVDRMSKHLKNVKIRKVDRKNLKQECIIFEEIFQEAWQNNWSYYPLTRDDFLKAIKEMSLFIDNNFAYIAEINNQPVGIFIAVPDPWEILQHTNGRIGLIGLCKILLKRRKLSHQRIFLMGMRQEYQSSPISTFMVGRYHQQVNRSPFLKTCEFSWISEDNVALQRAATRLGCKPEITYRVYDKNL